MISRTKMNANIDRVMSLPTVPTPWDPSTVHAFPDMMAMDSPVMTSMSVKNQPLQLFVPKMLNVATFRGILSASVNPDSREMLPIHVLVSMIFEHIFFTVNRFLHRNVSSPSSLHLMSHNVHQLHQHLYHAITNNIITLSHRTSLPDIDECLDPDRCGRGAVCQNTAGSFSCSCPEGFSGDPYTECWGEKSFFLFLSLSPSSLSQGDEKGIHSKSPALSPAFLFRYPVHTNTYIHTHTPYLVKYAMQYLSIIYASFSPSPPFFSFFFDRDYI